MDCCRAQRVPHRRPSPAALPGAAPRRPHRDVTRRDRRAQVVRPQRRPLPLVGVTHPAERRRPARRVRTQDPHQSPKRRVDRATLDELRRWRRQLERDGLPCGPDDWMFCNTTGRFLNPESISQLFDRIVQRSGLPRVRFHDCATPTRRCSSLTALRSRSSANVSVMPTRRSRCTPISTCAGHERRRSGTVRHARRHRQPVDVYRPISDKVPGQRLARRGAGRRRR